MRLLLCISALILCAQGTDAPLRFEATPAGHRVVARLPDDVAGKLPAGRLSQEQGEAVLTLSLDQFVEISLVAERFALRLPGHFFVALPDGGQV